MKNLFVLLILAIPTTPSYADDKVPNVVIAIHGGTSDHLEIPKELEPAVHAGLKAALEAGYAVLKKDGSSLDAVEAAVRSLEDNPLFNAGKGAVFTAEGKNEMDSSIMDGQTLKSGAVASVTTIKNPVTAAR